MSTRDVASVVFRHKLLICVTFLTVAIGTAAVAFLMRNQYESRMKILVKNTRTDVPITPERTSGLNGTAPESEVSENQINSEIELLTSKNLLNQVVTECDLAIKKPSRLQRLGLKETPKTAAGKLRKLLIVWPGQ